MKIFVKAKASAKKEIIKKIDETHFVVAVKEPPREGKANKAIIRALAGYFNISLSNISLTSGSSAKQKIFKIE